MVTIDSAWFMPVFRDLKYTIRQLELEQLNTVLPLNRFRYVNAYDSLTMNNNNYYECNLFFFFCTKFVEGRKLKEEEDPYCTPATKESELYSQLHGQGIKMIRDKDIE